MINSKQIKISAFALAIVFFMNANCVKNHQRGPQPDIPELLARLTSKAGDQKYHNRRNCLSTLKALTSGYLDIVKLSSNATDEEGSSLYTASDPDSDPCSTMLVAKKKYPEALKNLKPVIETFEYQQDKTESDVSEERYNKKLNGIIKRAAKIEAIMKGCGDEDRLSLEQSLIIQKAFLGIDKRLEEATTAPWPTIDTTINPIYDMLFEIGMSQVKGASQIKEALRKRVLMLDKGEVNYEQIGCGEKVVSLMAAIVE